VALAAAVPAAPSPNSYALCLPAEAAVDTRTANRVCKQLSAAGEGVLSGVRAYRLTYIPSFHPTRVVVASLEDGVPLVVGKVLSGKGGYEPGNLVQTTKRRRSSDEWRLLEQRLENAGLWEPTDRDYREILDGAEWVLEGHDGKHYRFHLVHSPEDTAFPQFRKVSAYMLELAGIRPSEAELY